MTVAELYKKWSGLTENNITNGFRSIRISSECLSDIFVGVNKDANRCLILALPQSFEMDFKAVVKENLTIEFFTDKNLIVLQLKDNDYYDLFDDLIISLYQRIKNISLVDEYSKEFIHTFYKWSEFFEDKRSELLSENIIKGLFGEILFLQTLIDESTSNSINDTLNSWKGPYDKGHDFEMNNVDIEVKTKDALQQDVKISSEFQLESSFEKQLELLVISVENDSKNGYSLKDLIIPIKNSVSEKLGDSGILLKALGQKGLTFKNIHQYDIFRFKPIHMVKYNCLAENFPKLTKSNIPKEVNSISYNLRLSALNEFIISKNKF